MIIGLATYPTESFFILEGSTYHAFTKISNLGRNNTNQSFGYLYLQRKFFHEKGEVDTKSENLTKDVDVMKNTNK